MKIQYGKSLEILLFGYNALFKTEFTLSKANIKVLKKVISMLVEHFYGSLEFVGESVCISSIARLFFLFGVNKNNLDLSKVKNISSFVLSVFKEINIETDTMFLDLQKVKKVSAFFAVRSSSLDQEEKYTIIKRTSNTGYNRINILERSLVLQSSSLYDADYKDLCLSIDFLFIVDSFVSFQNKKEFERIYSLLELRKSRNKFTYLILSNDEKFDLLYLLKGIYRYYASFDVNNYYYNMLIRIIGSFNE